MPKIRTTRTKKPPEGYEEMNLRRKRIARGQAQNGISVAHHANITYASRYIYELYYKREAISKELYDWLLKEGYADANMIAKWKKSGYEKLCCLRCIQTKDMNYQGSTCVCRVPKAQVRSGTIVECVHCGKYSCICKYRCNVAECVYRVSRM
ncbi:maternal g10 transcript [Mycena rebaudengoi]|nr:maternal g10 transcript [Mycena rebaudengoi]